MTNDQPVAKQRWTTPEVREYGTLADLTAQQAAGGTTDASFPAGTPVTDLTFSNGL